MAVEALAEAVVHWLSRRNETPDDPVVLRPGEHGVRGELGSIVRDDHAGSAPPLDQRCHFARHAPARDRGVGDRRQALSRNVIVDVHDAKATITGELVVDEIQRLAGVGDGLDEDRRPGSHGAPPRPRLAHREALFAIEAINTIDPGRLAAVPKQDEQPSVAEPLPLVGEVAQLCSQFRVRRSAGALADHRAVGVHDRAGPPFRQAHDGL